MTFPLNHDLHCHSTLSSCCRDSWMTPVNILEHAKACDYQTICLTNHVWDIDVPTAVDFYKGQDIAHITSALPLPQAKGIRFLFGCETEYVGGDRIGMARKHFDLFDFVAVPVNHFNLVGLVVPVGTDTSAESFCRLQLERLKQLISLDLPWEKIGIAHLYVPAAESEKEEARLMAFVQEQLNDYMHVFERISRLGAGVELNASVFGQGQMERLLPIYGAAKAAGCKFYCASDAHRRTELDGIRERLPPVVEALALGGNDLFMV